MAYWTVKIYQMSFVKQKEFRIAVGLFGLGAVLFALYKAYNHYFAWKTQTHNSNQETHPDILLSDDSQNEPVLHIPYDQLIEDPKSGQFFSGEIKFMENIKNIKYHIIFSLLKGNNYQGIVTITFELLSTKNRQYFNVSFQGTGIKYLRVNGHRIEHKQVKFQNNNIKVPFDLLKKKQKNTIQIIFENGYSFLGNGLSSYFVIDDHNKYSLRQQVIYSVPGWNQISHTFPCLNCTNPCSVHLEVIHPENFDVFSNSIKQLRKSCSVNDYQAYPFLFDLGTLGTSTNGRGRKNSANRGLLGSNASNISNMSDTMSNYTSVSMYNGRKRANSQFHQINLPSIHNLFIFCSEMVQLQPNWSRNPLEDIILIQYFCKYSQSHHFQPIITRLHNYVLSIYEHLSNQKISQKVVKLQIFIIKDSSTDGTFFPGAIILSEQTVINLETDMRCLYLITRSICGMLRLALGSNCLTINQIMALNTYVFENFEQLRGYMYLQNIKYQKIRSRVINGGLENYIKTNQAHFIQYYSKQIKYILKQNVFKEISFEISSLTSLIQRKQTEQFWQNFISNFNFISPLLVDTLIQLAINTLGVPKKQNILDILKSDLASSRHIIHFYSDNQISEDLPKFIECQVQGLQFRLPKVKILSKHKNFITDKYINFLPGKSNLAEAEAFYNQFKRFNEKKNFHHQMTLKKQINRVCNFRGNFILPKRLDLACSWSGWKLLTNLKIYPANAQKFQFLRVIDDIQQC